MFVRCEKLLFCFCPPVGGDTEEGMPISLAVPSTSPPSHGSPTGGAKDVVATPPSSPSMSSGLSVLGYASKPQSDVFTVI